MSEPGFFPNLNVSEGKLYNWHSAISLRSVFKEDAGSSMTVRVASPRPDGYRDRLPRPVVRGCGDAGIRGLITKGMDTFKIDKERLSPV